MLLVAALSVTILQAAPAPPFEHAIVISVDGLRSDALIALEPDELPGFTRLRAGASTLNARTDPDWTITLPNHTAMITGRFVEGEAGHGWTKNDEPASDETLAKKRGSYVAGIFDVAHDRGFATALYTGKPKFVLYEQTWDAHDGALDTVGSDEGRDKLDVFVCEPKTDALVARFVDDLAATPKRTLYFLHFATTDLTAHAHGWDVTPGSKYMQAVQRVDAALAQILDTIDSAEALRGRTAIVLTADHGGGAPFRSHDQKHMWVDYIIPFVVWTGTGGARAELYDLNVATRADPGLKQPPRDFTGLPPIRNGDAGNLALALLGLPAVPGSTIGAKQDLIVTQPR